MYTGPYVVTAVKGPNTYQISDKLTKKKKGVYNYTEIKYITHQKTKREGEKYIQKNMMQRLMSETKRHLS